MSIYTTDILKLIANNPRMRMPEICDVLDCEPEHVEIAVKSLIHEGHIIRTPVAAPNGKAADGFYFSPSSSKADLYRASKPAVPDAPQKSVKAARKAAVPRIPEVAGVEFDCAAWASGAITLVRGAEQFHLNKPEAEKLLVMLDRARMVHG